jgi:hypothetical protein
MSVLAGAAHHILPDRAQRGASYEAQEIKAWGECSDIAELQQASAVVHIRCFKTKRDGRIC